MFTTNLVKKKGIYNALHIINFLAILIAPFANMQFRAVDEGGGTAGEQEKEQKEKDELLKVIQGTIQEALTNNEKNLYTKEQLDTKLGEINKEIAKNLNTEDIKKLNTDVTEMLKEQSAIKESLETQAIEIKKLGDNGGSKTEPLKLGDIIAKQLTEQGYLEKNEGLSNLAGVDVMRVKGNSNATKSLVNFETKAAIDMTTALMLLPGSDPGTSIGYMTAYQMQEVLLNSSTDMSMLEVLPVTPITDKYFGVVVEYTEVDGTATTAENAAAGQSSFLLKTEEFKVFKINTYFKTSEENLEDISTLVAKMNRIGADRIKQKVNEKILAATGNGTTDIKGMLVVGNFTAFASATYANSVKAANTINLIGKMKLQAELTDDKVNVVILNPADIDIIEQDKDAIDNSVNDRSVVFDSLGRLVSIKGLLVVKTKKMTSNTCVVMSNEAAEVGLRKGINVVIGLDSDDLTKGMRTLVIGTRLAMGVGKASAIIYSASITGDVGIINLGV